MIVSYGTLPGGPSRVQRRQGYVLATVFGVGVLAIASVVYLSRSASPVSELAKVTAKNANKDMDTYFNSVNKEIKKSSRTLPYKSSNEARDDLDAYFNAKAAAKPIEYMSAKKALAELDYIFPTKDSKDSKQAAKKAPTSKKMVVTKGQILAFSHEESKEDLDDYFNNLDTSTHSHAWGDMDDASRKYIENKRKAIHHAHGGFTEIDKNGNTVEVKKVWSTANAQADMDMYYGGHRPADYVAPPHAISDSAPVAAAPAPDADAALRAAKAKKLHDAIEKDPALKTKFAEVHAKWMAEHHKPPSNPEEKAEYKKMVAAVVGTLKLSIDAADIKAAAAPAAAAAAATRPNLSTQYQVFNAYLDMHPKAAAKYDHFKKVWRQSHEHDLPNNAEEAKEYNALMTKMVGKLKINAEEVTNQWNALWDAKHGKKAAVAQADKTSSLKSKLARDASLKAKLDKVHAEWATRHDGRLPLSAQDKQEYREMLIKAGVINAHGSRAAATTTSLAEAHKYSPQQEEMAKQHALMDLEKHMKSVKKGIEKVHEEWMRHHKKPPQNAAEEKMYDQLLEKYVGHPDVSNQYVRDRPASAQAAPTMTATDDKMLDIDADLLN